MDLLQEHFPFTKLKKRPNVLIFPNLDSANIGMKLLRKLSTAQNIGPIMVGLDKPIHLVTRDTELNNIVNITAIACVDAQVRNGKK